MRRRIPYRVCQCMPNGVVTHLEARLLRDLVNREIRYANRRSLCRDRPFRLGEESLDIHSLSHRRKRL